ncbi:MAG TPA: hypothetical protein VKV73_20130 [Chloroflexota bacterium]|nr:hypothetical protein [Chloroflexota bacterium]
MRLLPNVLQMRGNDGPQLEAVRRRLDQPVQDDRGWLVDRQSVTHFSGRRRRRNLNDAICRQIRERLSHRRWLSVTASGQLIGANPRPILAGKNTQNFPLDRRSHVAFDEGQHRWIKLI